MDANTLLSSILGCGIGDINYLFSGMDDKLLCNTIDEIHNEDMEMSAENLWTECIQLAAERIFNTQADFIDSAFNCIDSRIFIKESLSEYIESFPMKKEQFEKLVDCELEILEGY